MPCFYLTPKQDDFNKIPELQMLDQAGFNSLSFHTWQSTKVPERQSS